MGGARADDQLIRRRVGLLEAAIRRPRASVIGQDAYDLVVAVAAGKLEDVDDIAAVLASFPDRGRR